MPRTNSISDSEGRSLTPDLEEGERQGAPDPAPHFPTAAALIAAPQSVSLPLELLRTQSGHSRFSKTRINTVSSSPPKEHFDLPPKEKFKAAVRRVIAIRRGICAFPGAGSVAGGRGRLGAAVGPVGDEPGVDPRRPLAEATYGHIQMPCEIEIVDYSAVRWSSRRMNNREFMDFMDVESEAMPRRDPWVKVRWINIAGMSWDVLKAVAIKYDLHPLALEDVLNGNPQTRSKVDYYARHLFVRVLCHQLADADAPHIPIIGPASEASSETLDVGEGEEDVEIDPAPLSNTNGLRHRKPSILPTHFVEPVRTGTFNSDRLRKLVLREKAMKAENEQRNINEIRLKVVLKGERVEVDVKTMNLFLLRDGTVISIHPTPSLALTAPISRRLRPLDTVLRKSADPSLLVHAILDLIVDKLLEIVDQYQIKINIYKHDILLRPKMNTVRLLHILSGDLILHKRTLAPIKTMIYGLRRYDVDRCAALVDSSDPKNKDVQVVGFMSHKAKIYLADVFDHMEYVLASLDMFADVSENLINYTFNISSHEMNEVMRKLTLVTIMMLPLTVLTGYFGMNFHDMWSVQQNSDLLFWEIALPSLAFVVIVALWTDIKKMWRYVEKRAEIKEMLKFYRRT